MRSLAEIADHYGCDKGLVGPSRKWSANNYVDVYEASFCRMRLEPLNLLEIGIGVSGERWDAKIAHGANRRGGASLKMWSEYFPNARIYALDINDASHLDSGRVRTFRVDQSSRTELAAFLAELPSVRFDIIIDDGSHRADHQQISIETLWPRLNPGRHYFVEDLNDRGFGERTNGRHAAPDTISTRELFRTYRETGRIRAPNAFEDPSFFAEIDDVSFFCPRPLVRLRDIAVESLRAVLGRNQRGMLRTEYNPTSHRIVALRKKRQD